MTAYDWFINAVFVLMLYLSLVKVGMARQVGITLRERIDALRERGDAAAVDQADGLAKRLRTAMVLSLTGLGLAVVGAAGAWVAFNFAYDTTYEVLVITGVTAIVVGVVLVRVGDGRRNRLWYRFPNAAPVPEGGPDSATT